MRQRGVRPGDAHSTGLVLVITAVVRAGTQCHACCIASVQVRGAVFPENIGSTSQAPSVSEASARAPPRRRGRGGGCPGVRVASPYKVQKGGYYIHINNII